MGHALEPSELSATSQSLDFILLPNRWQDTKTIYKNRRHCCSVWYFADPTFLTTWLGKRGMRTCLAQHGMSRSILHVLTDIHDSYRLIILQELERHGDILEFL